MTSAADPWGQYDRYLMSQVQIIKSSAVLERLKDRADVRSTQWYNQSPTLLNKLLGNSTDPYARLEEDLSADPVRKTELIEISMATANPRDAAVIVNALVSEYVAFVGNEFSEEDRTLLNELQEDDRGLTSQIALAERSASEVRRKLGTGSTADDLILQQRVRLDQLQGEQTELELQIQVKRQELEQARAALAEVQADSTPVEMPTPYLEDAEWQRLKAEVQVAEQQVGAGQRAIRKQASAAGAAGTRAGVCQTAFGRARNRPGSDAGGGFAAASQGRRN